MKSAVFLTTIFWYYKQNPLHCIAIQVSFGRRKCRKCWLLIQGLTIAKQVAYFFLPKLTPEDVATRLLVYKKEIASTIKVFWIRI